MKFAVTEAASHHNAPAGTCYFCKRAVGEAHQKNCDAIRRKVSVELRVVVTMPNFRSEMSPGAILSYLLSRGFQVDPEQVDRILAQPIGDPFLNESGSAL